jgi:hypothetical protein
MKTKNQNKGKITWENCLTMAIDKKEHSMLEIFHLRSCYLLL